MTSLATVPVEVTVDGQRLRQRERLGAVRIASRLSQPTQCELMIGLGHGEHPWPQEWSFGAQLAIQAGGEPGQLFTGEVTAVELRHRPDGTAELRVRAYDLLHRLRKRQHLRVFENVTAADVVAAVTGDLGLDLVVDEPGPRLDRVVQHRQSDFDLLVEVTAEAGLHVVLRGRELRLVTLAGYGDPVRLQRGTDLWDLRVEANLDRVARRVTAVGWHSQRAEVLTRPASAARGRPGRLDPDPKQVGVDGERFLVDRQVRGADQLAAMAQADLDASANRAVVADGVADGQARLWAGQRIAITGVAETLAGEYVLGAVVHTIDGAGYQSAFSTALPPRSPAPPAGSGTALTLGRVTGVDDPEGLGRVRVALTAYGDLDVGWLPVLCPGAGPDRGMVILPDTGDTVAVALPDRAPAGGVVLGSLYGTVPPPDAGVAGGAVRRWSMRTSAGQSLLIDDAEKSVRVQNQGGSFLELGPDRLRMHATTDLLIEAPGHGITVRARSVDFEQAT